MVDTTSTRCQCDCHKPERITWGHPVIAASGIVPDYLIAELWKMTVEDFRDWCTRQQVKYVRIRGEWWMHCDAVKRALEAAKPASEAS